MIPELEEIGQQLGAESVTNVIGKMEHFCAFEQQRIALVNEPAILRLNAELLMLVEEERGVKEKLRLAPPPGDIRRTRRRAIYYWTLTLLITTAGFFFTLLTFEPFRLGWESWLYCLGIATVTPFLVEKLLDDPRMAALVKVVTAVAAVSGLASLMALAVIRGDLLAEQFRSGAAPTVVIDDAQPGPETHNTFYDSALILLRVATVLLAFTMELGAGLALHEAWRMVSDQSEDWDNVRKGLTSIRERMAEIVQAMTLLRNEPDVFASRLWREFYRSMLTHTIRGAMTKLPLLLVGFLFLSHRLAIAENHSSLVVAVDLTKSVAVAGPDAKTDFQKNLDGVTRVLAQVPAGTEVTVLGITDQSFAQPYILLSARVSGDAGYFSERLNAARVALVHAWKIRSSGLQPRFSHTDILGALVLASQIFAEGPATGRKTLVLFSDMRNDTRDLNLESPQVFSGVRNGSGKTEIAQAELHDVQVFVCGVDGADKSVFYWQGLQQFWGHYFAKAGATMASYSVLWEVPQR